jgi:hypothetical protein
MDVRLQIRSGALHTDVIPSVYIQDSGLTRVDDREISRGVVRFDITWFSQAITAAWKHQ